MSFDLAQDETNQRIDAMAGTQSIDPSIFHNFLSGTAKTAMRGLAATGRTVDLLGAVAPVASDAITGGTEAQDRYFKEHDDVFNRAVDYWTPKPNEVGVAANIVGNLAVTLPMLIAAPELALPTAFAEPAEELVQKGVSAPRAAAVGSVQAAGQALGLWMPILGRTLPERLLLGAGSNVAQGVVTRGASQELLKGTPASDQYHALEPAGLTLDAILGLAFGSVAHLSPSWREQSKEVTDAIVNWAKGIKPSELDAVAALRQAQHKNLDSLPGIPATEADVDAHVSRMNKALDQAAQNQPIDVQDIKVQRDTSVPRGPLDNYIGELEDEIFEMSLRSTTKERTEGLLRVPPSSDAKIPENPSNDIGRTQERHLQELRQRLLSARETPERTLLTLRADGLANASPGLRSAFERDLALQGVPHVDSQESIEPRFTPDDARIKEANDRLIDLQGEAERVRQEEGLPKPETPETFERSPVFESVRQQLLDTGRRTPEQAETEAKLTEAFYRATAKHLNTTPEKLLEMYPLRITGAAAGEGALNQDVPTFYSELERQIDARGGKSASPEQWKSTIRNLKGVKADEIKWSGIEEWLDLKKGERVTKEQVLDFMRGNGVRVEETNLGGMDEGQMGIDERAQQMFGKNYDYLTNEQMAEVRQAQRQSGVPNGEPKFAQYQLPGGQNYRELLLTLPTEGEGGKQVRVYTTDGLSAVQVMTDAQIEAMRASGRRRFEVLGSVNPKNTFQSTHFDQPNILAHIRFNDRVDADGKKVLFVEEIQSDWAQKGKREGFVEKKQPSPGLPADYKVEQTEHQYLVSDPVSGFKVDIGKGTVESETEARQYAKRYFWSKAEDADKHQIGRLPSAPFVGKTEAWVALALKRMIAYAAEKGYDRIAWTNGEQQAARYDLSKHISELSWSGVSKGTGGTFVDISMRRLDGNEDAVGKVKLERLPDVVGKDLADKIVTDVNAGKTKESYSGLDLKVGGEGMKAFYDKIVPNVANDVLKKLGGGKVGAVVMGGRAASKEGIGGQSLPGFDITPELRERALKGMSLFQGGKEAPRGYYKPGEGKTIGLLADANASTYVHESGHMFLDITSEIAARPDAPKAIVRDMQILHKWFGLESGKKWEDLTLDEQRPYHEQFARGFEKFLGEGKAPTKQLTGVFERFKQWLIDVYKTLDALRVNLTDEVRGVMGRMIGGEPISDLKSPTVKPLRAGATPAQKSDLFADIQSLGGISKREMRDIIGENKARATKGLPPGLFKDRADGGRELDDLAIALREKGWDIPEGDDVNALAALIQAEAGGARAQRLGKEGKTGSQQTEQTAEAVNKKYTDLEQAAAEKHDFNPRSPAYQEEIKALRIARDLELADMLAEQGDRTGAEARRFVADNADLTIDAVDQSGNPIKKTVREFLDDAQAEAEALRKDKELVELAADCVMGLE